jgi:microcystin-dependent protein
MSVNVYNKNEDKLNLVAGGTLYADSPIGSIVPYGGTTVPTGWLLCQGQAVSRTTYAELFAVIGTAFGVGDGSTTFNVPDLREATTKGVGLSGKSENHYSENGVILGEFIEDRLQSHTHSIRNGFDGANEDSAERGDGRHGYSAKSNNASGRTGNTTEVKAVGVNYIIKAKHTPVPTDFADSLIGYLGKETNYNLYPWSHARTAESPDDNQDITIERDGWYSIDYTLTSNVDALHTFTLRDFDSLGEVHTIMRAHYDKSGTFRQTFLVPLKAGTYRYSHGGIGTLSVYMNRRDFA